MLKLGQRYRVNGQGVNLIYPVKYGVTSGIKTLLIILPLLLIAGFSQEPVKSEIKETLEDGKWIQWYSNGQKKEELSFQNKDEGGTVTLWYDNGQKWKEGSYKKGGEKAGRWTWWGKDGQIIYKRTYEAGVLKEAARWVDGNTLFFKHGNAYEINYDKPYSGKAVWYYENGKIEKVITYKSGKDEVIIRAEEAATAEKARLAKEAAAAEAEAELAAAAAAELAAKKAAQKAPLEEAAEEAVLSCQELSDEAEAAYREGDFQKALDLRVKVVQMAIKCRKELRAKNQYYVGYIYQKRLNNLDEAMKAYQKVIDNYPGSKYTSKAESKLKALQQ